jgi:hypothetical protein
MADHSHIAISSQHNLQVKRVVLSHLYVLAGDNSFKALNCNSAYICVYTLTHIYTTPYMHMYTHFMYTYLRIHTCTYKYLHKHAS